MSRLLSTLKLDMMIQFRSRLYHISIGLAVLLVVGMRAFFDQETLRAVIPVFFLMAIGGTTYTFVAGMVIFEKSENTLDGIIVTPLSNRDYIVSKVVSLTFIAVLETTTITLLAYGTGFNPFLLYEGILLIGFIMVLIGLIQVVRVDNVNDFLVGAFVIGVVTQLPVFLKFNMGLEWLWYAIPTAAPFTLMIGGFENLAGWQLGYGIGYSLVWLLGLSIWANQAFDYHIVQQGGS